MDEEIEKLKTANARLKASLRSREDELKGIKRSYTRLTAILAAKEQLIKEQRALLADVNKRLNAPQKHPAQESSEPPLPEDEKQISGPSTELIALQIQVRELKERYESLIELAMDAFTC